MQSYTAGFRVLDPRGDFLAGRGANETSQFGEDGLIAAALERFWVVNQFCFEVGAADGERLSNTYRLRNKGWTALLIEADAGEFSRLRRFENERVRTINERITTGSLDRLLKGSPVPDLGVIDIDGKDYEIWQALVCRPRLMLVEFHFETSRENGQDISEELPDRIQGQATFQAIVRLGREKHYVPLCKTTCNVLFAAEELLN